MPRTKKQFEKIRENTKRTILEAGLKLFAQKGFYATSISDIAKEAGVSKGLAYNYFSSKSELVEAILELILSLFEQYDILFKTVSDPYTILETIIKNTFKHLRENEEFWKLYTSFALQPEVSGKMKELFNDVAVKFIKKIEKIFRQIGIKNTKAEAYYFGALFDGISIDYLFNKETYPLNSVEKLFLKKYSKEELQKTISF